jgi:hypothetical protein
MKRLSILGSKVIHKTVVKISIVFLAGVTLLGVAQKTVFACTPVPITPWFSERLGFVETNLPSTIEHSSELTFSNTGDSPFYFQYHGETKDIGTQLSFGIFVYDDNDGIEINEYYFSEFDHRNKIGDDRPDNTLPPSYQDVIIPVTLDEKQYAIKLRITYEINQDYDPKSIEKQHIDCSYGQPFWQYCLNAPVIVGLAFLIALGVVVIIRRQKSSSEPASRIGK